MCQVGCTTTCGGGVRCSILNKLMIQRLRLLLLVIVPSCTDCKQVVLALHFNGRLPGEPRLASSHRFIYSTCSETELLGICDTNGANQQCQSAEGNSSVDSTQTKTPTVLILFDQLPDCPIRAPGGNVP